MIVLWIVGSALGVSLVGWLLLQGITRTGGQHGGDAAGNATAVVDQAKALFSNSSDEPWDGVDRLKTPPPDPTVL